MSGTDYKYVVPATAENIEVRLGCLGLESTRRIFLDCEARVRLRLFLRYGFCLIVEDKPEGAMNIRIAAPRAQKNLKLST
jgi:hypothetical protein